MTLPPVSYHALCIFLQKYILHLTRLTDPAALSQNFYSAYPRTESHLFPLDTSLNLTACHELSVTTLAEVILISTLEYSYNLLLHSTFMLAPLECRVIFQKHKSDESLPYLELFIGFPIYWVGQNVFSGFTDLCYRETQMTLLANPIPTLKSSLHYDLLNSTWFGQCLLLWVFILLFPLSLSLPKSQWPSTRVTMTFLLLVEHMDLILFQMLHLMFPILVMYITTEIYMVHFLLSFRPEILTAQKGPLCLPYLGTCW